MSVLITCLIIEQDIMAKYTIEQCQDDLPSLLTQKKNFFDGKKDGSPSLKLIFHPPPLASEKLQ